MRLGERARGDAYATPAEGELLTRPRLQEGFEQLVLELAAPAPLDTLLLVLGGPVPDPRDRHEPATAHQVEHRDVLGEPQRVVQRADDRGYRHRDAAGGAEDRAREDEGGRQPVVVRAV